MTDYEHIHHATNERLAEILESNARFEQCITSGIKAELNKDILPPEEWQEVMFEAARRLRVKPKTVFNSEAFE